MRHHVHEPDRGTAGLKMVTLRPAADPCPGIEVSAGSLAASPGRCSRARRSV
jgi:hypothetical protein